MLVLFKEFCSSAKLYPEMENRINADIRDKRYKHLTNLFTSDRPRYNYKKIIPPYDKIFQCQTIYCKDKTYENALNVLKAFTSVLEEEDNINVLIRHAIQNCINCLNSDQGNSRNFSKFLLEIYKSIRNNSYLTNILFSLYFQIKAYELCFNFLQITNSDILHRKQRHVYNLYKCFLLLHKHDLEQATESINISFRSYKIRQDAFFLFFIINLCNNKFISDKYIDRYTNLNLKNVKQTVKFGLVTRIDSDLEALREHLVLYNLYTTSSVYLRQICFGNFVRRLFDLYATDYKLDLKYITDCLEYEYLEIISILCSVIDQNLIKGYVSLNKNTIVFSRKNPFPMTFF